MARAARGREWRLHAHLDAVPPRVDDDARRGRAEEGVVHPRPLISMLRDDDLCNAARRQHSLGSFGACRTREFNKRMAHRARDPGGQFRHGCAQGLATSNEVSSGHVRVLHGKGVLQRAQRAAFARVTGLWWGG